MFTESTTAALSAPSTRVDFTFELRAPAHDALWQALPFSDFTLSCDSGAGGSAGGAGSGSGNGAVAPDILRVELCNDALAFGDESGDHPAKLFAHARLSCSIAGETELLFSGRVYRVEPRDSGFTLTCQDWLALLTDCECEVDLTPGQTDELAVRELALAGGGSFGPVWGFTYGGGGDPAFNAGAHPGTRRRSWAAGDVRLWRDADATEEVPPEHYSVDLQSGVATVLEDTTGRSYFAGGVRCYIEGSLDWADVFTAALSYPADAGGIGAASGELDLPPTGLDLAAPLYFRGRVSDLVKQVLSAQQANLRLWYDSRAGSVGEPGSPGRFKLRVVEQQPAGDEHFTLLATQSIGQPRDIRELYTRVVISGRSERPRNALTLAATGITDISTAGDWFAWDGLNVGADSDFTTVLPLLSDGDHNRGASLHNLAASEGGGTDKYDSWYGFVEIDLGELKRLSRLRATLPGSRNANAKAGHQGIFWPGLRLLASVDGTDWRLVSRLLTGRFAPLSQVEAAGADILTGRVRYLRPLLGAYKHGYRNQSDPSIGLAELEVYTQEEYRVVRAIDPLPTPASYYEYSADYDGDGAADSWRRNHPGLWQRLAGRARTRFEDAGDSIGELTALDRATDLLAESVRLFQQVEFTAVCDPRVSLYDTVAVPDGMNGAVAGILVERIVLRPGGTQISGTNYRAEALE